MYLLAVQYNTYLNKGRNYEKRNSNIIERSNRWKLTVEFLNEIVMGLFAAFMALAVLYGLAHWLQIAKFPKSKLKQELYQSGETVVPRKRRYLERTFIWLSYFSIVHVISFMLITLLAITAITGAIDIFYPLLYFIFTAFAILALARTPATT